MKILVVHASAGAGHMKAAEAVCAGLQKSSHHSVQFVDVLDHTSPQSKKLYQKSYFFMISKIPWFWGCTFWLTSRRQLQPLVCFLRRTYNRINAAAFHRFLEKEQFDYIVSTHFMPNEVASALKKEGRIRSTIIGVVTDFDVHPIWLGSAIDIYVVASDWTKKRLQALGVSVEKIIVAGIPIHEEFTHQRNIPELREKLNIRKEVFTVLVATGSFGIGPIEEIIVAAEGFQVIVVCGNNKKLYDRLSARASDMVHIKGLVTNMHELMAAADVMVTKPGGLSIAEALASQLPLVFFNPIPGQEAHNIEALAHHGIGVQCASVKDIIAQLKAFRDSKDTFLTALKQTRVLARPSAVRDILYLIS